MTKPEHPFADHAVEFMALNHYRFVIMKSLKTETVFSFTPLPFLRCGARDGIAFDYWREVFIGNPSRVKQIRQSVNLARVKIVIDYRCKVCAHSLD
jgi:hypothetical protein